MRKMKNNKLKAILSITGYFLLVIALCVSASIVFHNVYYETVFVSGSSMQPNLNLSGGENAGDLVDFGIVDRHSSAINNIKRFSIISTYYSDDYGLNGYLANPKQKIKRVIAMPNETFKIENSQLFIKDENNNFNLVSYTFDIIPNVNERYTGKDIGETTLGEDEYWVLGDHRDKSRDCGSEQLKTPIKKSYIVGVLVAIEGQATLNIKNYVCPQCAKTYKKAGICQNCYVTLNASYELKNKQYHWPTYF